MTSYPPQVGTIGITIAADHHMAIYCEARRVPYYRHHADVDLEALRTRYGPDSP